MGDWSIRLELLKFKSKEAEFVNLGAEAAERVAREVCKL